MRQVLIAVLVWGLVAWALLELGWIRMTGG